MCAKLKAAFDEIFLHHPEVKCLSATVCWHGNLNDAQINHGVWLGDDGGPVRDVAGIVGSAYQTLKLLDEQCGQGVAFVNALREQVVVLSKEVVKRNEEVQAQEAQRADGA